MNQILLPSEIKAYIDNPDNAWLDIRPEDVKDIENPLLNRSETDKERPDKHIIKIMRNPKYFGFTCKVLFGIDLLPLQIAVLQELWVSPFPMLIASRGFSKSFLLAIYSLLRCILIPESKIIVVGAAFRQSKVVFEYMETIWNNAPVFRSICDDRSGPTRDVDRCTMRVNKSWTLAIPLGSGDKIRGLRAHVIIAEEFASIAANNADIYETVIAGFAAVSATPVENVKGIAKRKKMIKDGTWNTELEAINKVGIGNQSIICGTADYDFRPFAAYWKRYKAIIDSKGDRDKLEVIFNGEVPENFNWKDYSVIRIPYELIPEGMMDARQVMRSKATMNSAIYQLEYGAVFVTDSDGFFRRTLIESCVGKDTAPIKLPSGEVWFDARTSGDNKLKYVYGIDPAFAQDNFTIVVLELHNDHTRIVYGWSTNEKNHKDRLSKGLTEEHDYYGFCARKIRDLMKVFPPERIGMDSQGGGYALMEALHDPHKLKDKEYLIWEVINPEEEKDSDYKAGLHLVELVNFGKAEWTHKANHNLRKDFESRVLLFPRFDSIVIEMAIMDDKARNRVYDSLEDAVMEIEELKDELSTIVVTRVGTGANARDRWDTPETKSGNKKGRMRKDRYSALLIANTLARDIHRADIQEVNYMIGGVAHVMSEPSKSAPLYQINGCQTLDPGMFIGISRGGIQ